LVRRNRLTKNQRIRLLEEQGGVCACCRLPSPNGVYEDDHIIALACGGSNDHCNRQLLCPPCHLEKTVGKDIVLAAKIKRQSLLTGQQARRKRRGKSSIVSRGFDKRFKKKLDGTVEEKDDG